MDAEKNNSCRLCAIPAPQAAALYENCVRPALLQAPLYAAAYGAYAGWTPVALRIEIDGRAAGLAQLLTRRCGFIRAVALDQGPAWGAGYGAAADYEQFFARFARDYPAGLLRRRRVIPACADKEAAAAQDFSNQGLRRVEGSSYATAWIDLENEIAMRRNWRQALARARRPDVALEWDGDGRTLEWLLRHEAQARRRKNYPGPSAALVRALAPLFIAHGQLLVGRVLCAGRPVAGALFLLHPPAATYLLAWTGAAGRACGAQNLLLHDGLRILKQRHIRYLDLGGINDVSACGVGYFKRGLGGEVLHQSGIYR